MKTNGKYEKQPKAKSLLLQTYLTSLLCMVLCVAMFLGTSYAWFTSEVTNEANELYIGILDVELAKKMEDGKWKSLSEKIDGKNTTKLFDKDIRWEPGYTTVETVKVVNEGELAFRYMMTFTDGKVTNREDEVLSDKAQKNAVAELFDIWVYDYSANENADPTATSYEKITEKDSGWVPAGTLAEAFADGIVLGGEMGEEDVRGAAADKANKGTVDGKATEHTYAIALHMKEDADISVMGHKISLNAKLVAYQLSSEEDAFDSSYDDVQFVATKEELQDALDDASGQVVIALENDIEGTLEVTQKDGVEITIDGGGKTFAGVITIDGKSAATDTAALTIRNVNFKADSIGTDGCIRLGEKGDSNTRYTNHVTVSNCTFDIANGREAGVAAIRSYTGGDKNLTVKNCVVKNTMHSLLQVNNVENLVIENCQVYSKNGANLNSTTKLEMTGCTFDVTGYAVRFGVDKGGNPDDAKTFTLTNNTLKSACDDGDAVIIFRASAVNATLNLVETTLEGTTKISGNTSATTINGLN